MKFSQPLPCPSPFSRTSLVYLGSSQSSIITTAWKSLLPETQYLNIRVPRLLRRGRGGARVDRLLKREGESGGHYWIGSRSWDGKTERRRGRWDGIEKNGKFWREANEYEFDAVPPQKPVSSGLVHPQAQNNHHWPYWYRNRWRCTPRPCLTLRHGNGLSRGGDRWVCHASCCQIQRRQGKYLFRRVFWAWIGIKH